MDCRENRSNRSVEAITNMLIIKEEEETHTNLPGPHCYVREAGLDAIGVGILNLSQFLECQESLGLELVFPMGIMAVVPKGTRFTGNEIETEFGLDLLHVAFGRRRTGARSIFAFGWRSGLLLGFGWFWWCGKDRRPMEGARRRRTTRITGSEGSDRRNSGSDGVRRRPGSRGGAADGSDSSMSGEGSNAFRFGSFDGGGRFGDGRRCEAFAFGRSLGISKGRRRGC